VGKRGAEQLFQLVAAAAWALGLLIAANQQFDIVVTTSTMVFEKRHLFSSSAFLSVGMMQFRLIALLARLPATGRSVVLCGGLPSQAMGLIFTTKLHDG
jgi:hypothetical protein